jgi:hypothetical protein
MQLEVLKGMEAVHALKKIPHGHACAPYSTWPAYHRRSTKLHDYVEPDFIDNLQCINITIKLYDYIKVLVNGTCHAR